MRLAIPVLVLWLVFSFAFIPNAMAQNRSRVTIFRESDFRGVQRTLDRELRDFRSIDLNDRVSSIRVESGAWEFCEDADFRGRCFTVSRDVRDLVGGGFDDRISSARPVADGNRRGDDRRNDDQRSDGGGAGSDVVLYADAGFSGASREAGDSRDFRSLDFNDTVSSIRIRSGTWEFCEDADFRGRCMTFDRDVPSLVPQGFNDKISSMRRVR